MNERRVCLLAHDAAPSSCFDALGTSLRATYNGLKVSTAIGNGKPIVGLSDDDLKHMVQSSHFLLLGMSSSSKFAEIEIKAGEWAREAGIPYGFYSDVTYATHRATEGLWFHELAQDAQLVLGLLPKTGISGIFPKAHCVNTGNPLREETAFQKISRAESRNRLEIRDDQILIIAPGGKFAAGNSAIWILLLETLSRIPEREKFVVVMTPHPGDTTLRAYDRLTDKNLPIYAEICEDAPVRTLYVTRDTMTTSEVLAGADLVVEFTTSTSIEAAYQRIPVISVMLQSWLTRFEKESGLHTVEAVGSGASIPVYGDIREFECTILNLIDKNGHVYQNVISAQESAYPIPSKRGEALSMMVEEIGRFVFP